MAGSRIAAALAQGGLALPEGRRVAMRPAPGFDLGPLGAVDVVTTNKIEADFFDASGDFEEAALVLVCLPRAKDLARAMIAEAAEKASALVMIDGMRSDGIDSIWRELRKLVPGLAGISKSHGRLLWFAPDEAARAALQSWRDPGPQPDAEGLLTQPGVFSAGKVDAGSRLLAEALPEDLRGEMADLGAGWGYLSAAALALPGLRALHLVEVEARALDCARRNVDDPRAHFHWADATRWRPPAPLDAVVMNPPFHTGRDGAPELGMRFIDNAAACLAPSGQLWMVANRHLPYEERLEQRFARVEERPGTPGFKLFHAARPRRA